MDPMTLDDHCAAVAKILCCNVYLRRARDQDGTLKFPCEASELRNPRISYDSLMELSEHFGTTHIDIEEFEAEGGCPTCGDDVITFTLKVYTKGKP